MSNNTAPEKKKKSYLSLLGIKLFGGKKKLSLLEEEQMQSPFRTIVKNFVSNKLAMFGLILFLAIFAVVLIGPIFYKIDLGFTESSQINVAPGFNLLSVPKALQGNVADIAVGPTFSVGVDNDGKVYMWGKTKVAGTMEANNIPDNMGKVVRVSAGFDHVLALNDQGEVFAWGNDRMNQCKVPSEVQKLDNVVDVIAGYQCSIALTEDGDVYMWGNTSMTDFNKASKAQGNIAKVVVTSDAVLGLTKDGEAVYLGKQKNAYSSLPENMGTVVDIAATSATMSAVNDAGEVFVWGNVSTKGEGNVPEVSGKIVELEGGRYHYTAVTEDGEVVAWGDNSSKQSTVPASVKNADIEEVYNGYFQNYAITSEGKVLTWGLKGYLLGTDDLGRDIFTRLINGGRMTMSIGAIAVVISTIIGVAIGCISGFFGGKVDLVLQRITEIISSLPFLPFAMILTSLIGNKLDQNQRILLIMVILGLLSWPSLSRLVRAQVLAEREKEFVTAAKAMGVKQMSIVFKHILPNVVSVIIVTATLDFATCMLTESTLSYLGFGVNPPQPTWGNMLYGSNNSVVIQNFWWRWVFTSIILGVCTICINLVGDGLRDAVDPKSNER
ncbi:MAG: ABC transporter permease subunit [Lachnospiraceae bacterium]